MQKKADKYRKLYNYPDPIPPEMKYVIAGKTWVF